MASITSPFNIFIDGQPIAPPPPPTFSENYVHAALGNKGGPAALLRVVNDYIESGDWYLDTHPLEQSNGLYRKIYWLRKSVFRLKEGQKVLVQKQGNTSTVKVAGYPLCKRSVDNNVWSDHVGGPFGSRVIVTLVG
ncbi:hypothetical protein PT974_08063 [Cladobotryum mycophilum]|uniref:Uncharacterized protein n=1 Tax=Cladobotryum mycophilum TaxID=491253 RepID=A0ABR0SCA5_9HYPO